MIRVTFRGTEYSAPTNGGYIRDEHGNQPCDALSTRGSTLLWFPTKDESPEQSLLALLRKHRRKQLRQRRKQERDYGWSL